jgi:tetratricopeptide (TPR) repeat protein
MNAEKIAYMLELRASNNDVVAPFAQKFPSATFYPGKKAWSIKCDIAMPCAFQNELTGADAEELLANGTWLAAEVSNMGCTPEAIAAFQKGAQLFEETLASGVVDEAGSIYYFLFHCYYGQRSADRAYITKAKETLLTGIDKFPKNNNILDGLMQLYTAEEGVGDPAELIDRIETSLKDDPTNYDLWFGRGRVFNALKNYDECVNSFVKCAELRPEDFESNYFVGYFIIEKANALLDALNSRTDVEDYDAEVKKVDEVFAQAIPWLEKAHNIDPAHRDTIVSLRQLFFRLREMEGMMEKYSHYRELENQL